MKVLSKGINELQDVTITHVSYVKRGANKKTFFLSKSEENLTQPDVEFDVRVIRSESEEKKLLYGVVYEPMEIDTHGDMMKADGIEKMAHEFMVHYRNIDVEHNLIAGAGQVVESYIAQSDIEMSNQTIKKGSWILVTKATDEIWNDYLNGEITGYSMYGIARKSVTKTEPEISGLQKLMEKTGLIKSFADTVNDTIDKMKSSPWFIMDMVYEDFFKTVEWDMVNDEQLGVLKDSLVGATEYISGILASRILKSETGDTEPSSKSEPEEAKETEPETEPENPVEPTEPEVEPVEPETKLDTSNVNVSCSETEETELEKVSKSVQQVMDTNKELTEKVQKLEQELVEKNQQLEKTMVKSNYVIPSTINIIEPAKPKFF